MNGSPADKGNIRGAIARIASDGRKNAYENDLLCKDIFLQFRAKSKDFTYRRSEAKGALKKGRENYSHVDTSVKVLEEYFRKHPQLRCNPEATLNIDETKVRTEFGERGRALIPATTHHGAGRVSSVGYDKHVTAVIVVKAAGRVCPPFFITAGKNTMSSWNQPSDADALLLGTERCRYGK